MPIVPWGQKSGSSGGAVSSVSNSDGTLTISPTTGSVVASIPSGVALPGNPTTTTQTAGDNSTKIATDAFVTTAISNAIAAVNPAVAVQAATTSAANTSGLTYVHVAGIGDTFTGSINTAIVFDGHTLVLGDRVLIKNDTQTSPGSVSAGVFNGIYTVTQVQTIAVPPILTRALDYDTPSDINNTGAIPVLLGTVNAITSWILTTSITAVGTGTNVLTYQQFSYGPTTIIPPNLGGTGVANNSASTITLASAKTLAVNNSLTLAGTDATTMTFPSTSATVARTDAAQTFSGQQTFSGAVYASATNGINMGSYAVLIAPGTDNYFVGAAGNTSLTGTNNTGLGFSALTSLTSGIQNVALGQTALNSLTTGGTNTSLGYNSLQANSTGSGNVALGTSAGAKYTGSNAFFVNNVTESSSANDLAYSLLYGSFSGSAASLSGQQLTVNGTLNVNGALVTPAWTSYTPTLANITVGNGTLVATYLQIGKLIQIRVSFTLGSTSSVSGVPTVSLPVNTNSAYVLYQAVGTSTLLGPSFLYPGTAYWNSSSTVALSYHNPGTGSVIIGNISSTAPFTWGTGHMLSTSFSYESV